MNWWNNTSNWSEDNSINPFLEKEDQLSGYLNDLMISVSVVNHNIRTLRRIDWLLSIKLIERVIMRRFIKVDRHLSCDQIIQISNSNKTILLNQIVIGLGQIIDNCQET